MSAPSDGDVREKLKATLDEAEWEWLKPHLLRDVVIVVALELDLLEAAVAVAQNQREQVQQWIQSGKLGKPTADQIARWNPTPEKKFLCVVVQPFVLVQEHLLN